jgi:hypothetical protein
VQQDPAAALLLAGAHAPGRDALLPLLAAWAPGSAAQGLQLLSGPSGKEPAVRTYATKCLLNERPEKVRGRAGSFKPCQPRTRNDLWCTPTHPPAQPHPPQVVFYLPQLVQLLRGDDDGAVTGFFTAAASHSDLFAHRLIWALRSEGRPPEEAFNPEVKR